MRRAVWRRRQHHSFESSSSCGSPLRITFPYIHRAFLSSFLLFFSRPLRFCYSVANSMGFIPPFFLFPMSPTNNALCLAWQIIGETKHLFLLCLMYNTLCCVLPPIPLAPHTHLTHFSSLFN